MGNIVELCEITPAWEMTEEEWLAERQKGIGGSEIGSIAGLSKYEKPYAIWLRKTQNINAFEGNEATELGHLLEPAVALGYAKKFNAAVVEWPVVLRSKKYSFLSANVDRFIVEPSELFPAGEVTVWKSTTPPAGIQALLECKTGALASPGKPTDWFTGGGIPLSYTTQGLWYLTALELERIEYACLLGGHGLQFRTLYHDADLANDLLQIGKDFWENHVLTKIPPPLDGSDSTEEALKAQYPSSTPGKFVEGGDALISAWEDFQYYKHIAESAEADKKAARARVVSIIGDAEVATAHDVPVCSYKSSKDTEYFADKIFENDHPDLAAKYKRTRPGHRTLREVK